jgi:ketosteroid isomerase-like protein
MNSPDDLLRRIRRLEDRAEIGELVARYCLVMDDRDMTGMTELFTPDAIVRSSDGVMHASGLTAVTAMFRARFAVLGPSNHFTHDRIVRFEEDDPGAASGIVLAHAEMNRKGQPMLAAIRYTDRYRRLQGRWRIAERVLSFFYYVPTAEYLDALGPGLAARMRAYDVARPADWPEGLESWREYYGP